MIYDAATAAGVKSCKHLPNPARDAFLNAVDDFILDMNTVGSEGSAHLFYYAGDGCEINCFRFIPIDATRADRDYIARGDIMEQIDKKVQGHIIVFCIDACRNNPDKEKVKDRFDNERGRSNRYCLLFRTSVGNEINELEEEGLSVFAETVREFIPKLSQFEMIPDWIEQITQVIKSKDEREDPWCYECC